MKTIWIVISGIDFEDCQSIEGCFLSLESARDKIDELKAKNPGKWPNNYIFDPITKEKTIQPYNWSHDQHGIYLKIIEEDLLP